MAIWAPVNRTLFKKTSTYFLVATLCTFFFERGLDMISLAIFEHLNKNKLWKDVKDRFKKKEVKKDEKTCK
ncbi:unnamed protein product [Spodoptera littoralis]|uniref:Complex III subunit 9 n=1 Tax=Spodoptera littoralis TaxID=7109 RepID=A0A9P0N585_SPOLI|nr:unnamed protein product [Spodoptera littoralis]CAH1642873.1 unnamed protein product [Spodoptera littoralis]